MASKNLKIWLDKKINDYEEEKKCCLQTIKTGSRFKTEKIWKKALKTYALRNRNQHAINVLIVVLSNRIGMRCQLWAK